MAQDTLRYEKIGGESWVLNVTQTEAFKVSSMVRVGELAGNAQVLLSNATALTDRLEINEWTAVDFLRWLHARERGIDEE